MGIWDFVKEAGELLGIGGAKEAKADDLNALGQPRSRHSAGHRGLNCDRRRTECRSSR